MRSDLGRPVFGVTVLACGLVTLAWHVSILSYVVGAGEVVGGIAILFGRTAKAGAIIIGTAYLVLALLSVPQMIANPQIYASWGNFFYPFALVIGAAIVVARFSPAWDVRVVARTASVLFGICVASYGIEQVEFLARTASLVPTWIPPSQMFWAIATCVPFALAAVALIANRFALPATRLFALMMLLFGILVWIPILFADPHTRSNWVEGSETFATAGAAWILADFLAFALEHARDRPDLLRLRRKR
jgi:uncharacterized membrane protein YphA (DoxX/SURF4 family)